ncbi:MAG TPA: hypothetical protein VFU21_15755 [Kofleriaceae bacterium]|nr:hypothetical protein [Kofleriaceae bacterium]
MIAIVAPEPAAWPARVAALAAAVDPDVRVLAPWAIPDLAPLRALSHRLPFLRRRLTCVRRHQPVPGWPLAELALAAWIGERADRRLRAVFLRRAAVDRLAAAQLARAPGLRAVIAPSLTAERTFAAAARAGARTILLEDLPALRQLQDDLDSAAACHPDCRFLRRYRAGPGLLARQEVEWAMADRLLVRGAFARAVRAAAGVGPERVVDGPDPLPASGPRAAGRPTRVLLAGLAAARHGTCEALALLAERPDLELVVRAGEGLEPAGLLEHPRVRRATAGELSRLDGIGLVLAPAWCESYPDEIARAVSHGVPVAGTLRAAGFVDLDGLAAEPGDVRALSAAIDMAVAFPRRHEQAAARWRAHQDFADMQLENALRVAPSTSGPVLASPPAFAT